MSGAPWTPGPWRVRDTGSDIWVEAPMMEIPNPNGRSYRRQILEDGNYPEKLADAALIAAAPEMAEALDEMASVLTRVCRIERRLGGDPDEDVWADVQAAQKQTNTLLSRIRGEAP